MWPKHAWPVGETHTLRTAHLWMGADAAAVWLTQTRRKEALYHTWEPEWESFKRIKIPKAPKGLSFKGKDPIRMREQYPRTVSHLPVWLVVHPVSWIGNEFLPAIQDHVRLIHRLKAKL